jgi:sensor histidine kinase YesM
MKGSFKSHIKSSNPNILGLNPENLLRFFENPWVPLIYWVVIALIELGGISRFYPELLVWDEVILNFVFSVSMFYYLVLFVLPRVYFLRNFALGIFLFCLSILVFVVVKVLVMSFLTVMNQGFQDSFLLEVLRSIKSLAFSVIYFLIVRNLRELMNNYQLKVKQMEYEVMLNKMVLSPHFIFNCLSAISSEYYKVAEAPSQKISELSELIYYSMHSGISEVKLEIELQYVEKFLAFQVFRTRGRENILFCNEVPLDLGSHFKIPKMVLVTIVENVFKHGDLGKSSQVDISAKLILEEDHTKFCFETRNIIKEINGEGKTSGIGLEAIRSILGFYFGSAFSLSSEASGNKFICTLTIIYYEKLSGGNRRG